MPKISKIDFSDNMDETGILLIGHGSSLPFNEMVFKDICQKISDKLEIPTEMSYVKLSKPSIEEAVAKLNCENIIAQPLMLCEGRLTKKDIPEKLGNIKQLPTIGANPLLCEIIATKIENALAKSELENVEIEVILLAHGSEFEYNEEFLKTLTSQMDLKYPVHYSFLKYNSPSIQDVFKDIKSDRVVVIPVFVTDGIHTITDIPIILGLIEPPEPCPFMKDGKHHPDHAGMHGHNDDPTHRPQHHSLKIIDYDGEVLLGDSFGDDDRLIDLWCENIRKQI